MRSIALPVLIALVTAPAPSAPAVGQPAPRSGPSCEAQLDWIADHARRNYAGFEFKTAGEAGARYEALLAELRQLAVAADSTPECDAVLARWVAFFEDGHLSFGRAPAGPAEPAAPESDDAIRARLAGRERLELSEAEAVARIDARRAQRSPIEGIWQLGDAYRVAVVRDERPDRDYTMTTLRADSVWWVPGQVKATFARDGDGGYAVRFYLRDHTEQRWTARVVQNALVMDRGSPWFRVWPTEPGDPTPEEFEATRNRRFTVSEPVPGTVVVQLPTFADALAVDSLFAAERGRIETAERLIVDLRDNGGGSDYNFRHLIPLIYTGPIHVAGSAALATEENLRAHRAILEQPDFPDEQRAGFLDWIERIERDRGGWHVFPDRVIEQPEVRQRPRTVAVLVNRGCASSCEQFLLAARQSGRVTIFGERTAGILDFGNVRGAQMPGTDLWLQHPTTRSTRLPHDPVDPHGIQPHVEVPATELDPVGWVLEQLVRHATEAGLGTR